MHMRADNMPLHFNYTVQIKYRHINSGAVEIFFQR